MPECGLTICLKFVGARMYFPVSLIGLILVIVIGFCVSMYGAIQAKAKTGYQKLPTAEIHSANPGASYQNSAEYALPPKQKVVTYCVIDGRLVDQ